MTTTLERAVGPAILAADHTNRREQAAVGPRPLAHWPRAPGLIATAVVVRSELFHYMRESVSYKTVFLRSR